MPRPRSSGAFFMTNMFANRILIPLLKSRAGQLLGRRLAVVEYVGRRSGTHHQLVTGYARDLGVVRITVGAADRKTWWRNFAAPHPIRLCLAGDDYAGLAYVARDAGQVRIIVEPLDAPVQVGR